LGIPEPLSEAAAPLAFSRASSSLAVSRSFKLARCQPKHLARSLSAEASSSLAFSRSFKLLSPRSRQGGSFRASVRRPRRQSRCRALAQVESVRILAGRTFQVSTSRNRKALANRTAMVLSGGTRRSQWVKPVVVLTARARRLWLSGVKPVSARSFRQDPKVSSMLPHRWGARRRSQSRRSAERVGFARRLLVGAGLTRRPCLLPSRGRRLVAEMSLPRGVSLPKRLFGATASTPSLRQSEDQVCSVVEPSASRRSLPRPEDLGRSNKSRRPGLASCSV
jgi:hypothetical protein